MAQKGTMERKEQQNAERFRSGWYMKKSFTGQVMREVVNIRDKIMTLVGSHLKQNGILHLSISPHTFEHLNN